MNKNESDALLELERLCRIVVYQGVSGDEVEFFRKTLKTGLEKISNIRKVENAKKQAMKEERARKKMETKNEIRRY